MTTGPEIGKLPPKPLVRPFFLFLGHFLPIFTEGPKPSSGHFLLFRAGCPTTEFSLTGTQTRNSLFRTTNSQDEGPSKCLSQPEMHEHYVQQDFRAASLRGTDSLPTCISLRQEKGSTKTNLGPDIFWWGGGLPLERVGLKSRKFCWDSPGVPQKFVSNSCPLFSAYFLRLNLAIEFCLVF